METKERFVIWFDGASNRWKLEDSQYEVVIENFKHEGDALKEAKRLNGMVGTETIIRGKKLDDVLTTKEFITAAIDGELPWKPCKKCGYKEQDTRKYEDMCYQCYADKHHIYG